MGWFTTSDGDNSFSVSFGICILFASNSSIRDTRGTGCVGRFESHDEQQWRGSKRISKSFSYDTSSEI